MNLFQEDPRNLEEWEDLVSWKQTLDQSFKEALWLYFKNKLGKLPDTYYLECLTEPKYSEISLLPNILNYDFIDKSYEISGLFVNNHWSSNERFFILKHNNKYYGLDISKEFKFLINQNYVDKNF